MSRSLETGVPQRDFRVWLHPKRRLACPLRRLPMKPNGPRQRRRMDVPRRGTLLRSGQYANSAKRYSVSSFRAKREIFAIRGLAVNVWKFQTGNLLSTYLRASPHIYGSEAATTTLNPEPRTPNPEPRTPNPEPRTPNPEPSSLLENAPCKIVGLQYMCYTLKT